MTTVRTKLTEIQMESAKHHRFHFETVIKFLMMNVETLQKYDDAVKYLLEVIDAGKDLYTLKKSDVKYLTSLSNTYDDIADQVHNEQTERFQLEGTQQNFATTYEYDFKTIYVLVNYLYFTVEEAENINKQLKKTIDFNGGQYKLIHKFVNKELGILAELILQRIKNNEYTAEQAYLEIINAPYSDDIDTAKVGKYAISKGMLNFLDQISVQKNALELFRNEIKKVKSIAVLQNNNRLARCHEAKTCSKKLKEEIYYRSRVIQILNNEFLRTQLEKDQFAALESSLATDELACTNAPSVKYIFRNTKQLLRNQLGFFACNVTNLSSELKENVTTFTSMFKILMNDLTENCHKEQFLSLFAMGLAIPIWNSAAAYFNSTEMDLFSSVHNNRTLAF